MKINFNERKSTFVSVVMNPESAEKSYNVAGFNKLVCEKFNIPSFGFEKEMSICDAFDEILTKQSVSDWFLAEFGLEIRLQYNVGGFVMYGNTTSDGVHQITHEFMQFRGGTHAKTIDDLTRNIECFY